MDHRAVRGVAALCIAAAACTAPPRSGVEGRPEPAPPSRATPPPPEPLENADGIRFAPRDDTEFVYDLEPEGAVVVPPEIRAPVEVDEVTRRALQPYLDVRRSRLAALGRDADALLILTRATTTTQAFLVGHPGDRGRQLTFGTEPVAQVAFARDGSGDILFRRDRGGNEDYQIYRASPGSRREWMLSDGISRHGPFRLSPDGRAMMYTGNARNDQDMDVYAADAQTRDRTELISERSGEWVVGGWSADASKVLLLEYRARIDTGVHLLDVATHRIKPLPGSTESAAYQTGALARDGNHAFVLTDRDSDFVRVARVALASGTHEYFDDRARWDAEELALSPDGSMLAYTVNEAGFSRLYV